MSVSRFGVSLESELLEALDEYVRLNRFPNRSQAIRHLIERHLVEKKWQCDNIVAGTVILIYDPAKRDLAHRLMQIRQEYHAEILSAQQFFSEQTCLEVIALKGKSRRLTELSDKLIAQKGVCHGKLVMTQSDSRHK
jgi:CopG family nickel-responsive transcriptional regulator